MTRSDPVKKFSAQADSHEKCLEDPRRAISRTLYVPRQNGPAMTLERWKLPIRDAVTREQQDFDKLLRNDRVFVVGGMQFVIDLGLAAAWVNDQNRRAEALDLIRSRNWEQHLDKLWDGRDPPDNLIGQETVQKIFRSLPSAQRAHFNAGSGNGALSPKERWDFQLVRLRKAVELITLIEATVAHELAHGRLADVFTRVTNRPASAATAETDALAVWDYLWIEPVLFQLVNGPREADITSILDNPRYLAQFRNDSGQWLGENTAEADRLARGVLYWVFRGTPGKWRTIEAAANLVNAIYSSGGGRAQAVTMDRSNYMNRILKRPREQTPSVHDNVYEDVLELGA
jgi:hypothetical protein